MLAQHSNRHPILLIGGSGRVGQMLASHLENMIEPPDIVLQTRCASLSNKFQSLLWDPLDGPGALLEWHHENGPFGSVIAFAGITPSKSANLSQNTTIARAIVEACLIANIPRVLLASSSAVYGVGQNLNEATPLAPLNPYGEAKRDMEAQAAALAGNNLNLSCLRIGNVAGADALLINAVDATAKTPLQIDCFADGHGPFRSYIGPVHLAEALLALAQSPVPLPPVLNVAAQRPIDMIDLARAEGAPMVLRTALPGAVQHITLDCSKFENLTALPENAPEPKEMVRQWHSVRRPS